MPESPTSIFTSSKDVVPVIPEKFQASLQPSFEEYAETSRVFFDFLCSLRSKGWSGRQFEVLRDNYFYRTRTTASSVARVVVSALSVCPPDIRTASEITRLNLLDEIGRGHYSESHISQLEESFSVHGQICFELPPVSIQLSEGSSLVVAAAKEFRKLQLNAYTHKSYLHVLGASAAQEYVAYELISAIYENVFLIYRDRYPPSLWVRVARYFDSHLDGTEISHARLGFEAAQRNVINRSSEDDFAGGWKEFLLMQSCLWRDLVDAMSDIF